jgi:protein ECT2
VSVHSQDVGIEINEIPLGTLSKAFRLATRTRLKVGRAFSFNKTPSRGGERKRNVQSPISKATSNVSLTPSTISSMSHLKLHSSLSLASNVSLNSFQMIFNMN